MNAIPLEDSYVDVMGKAQRGIKLSDEELARKAGLSTTDLGALNSGKFDERLARAVAVPLRLSADALVALGRKTYAPDVAQIDGLKQFNTVYEDMTVNSYLVYDRKTRQAAAFDTGGECASMLEFARSEGLGIAIIFLTHTHVDHVADLDRLQSATRAKVFVGENEKFDRGESFAAGRSFTIGGLGVETRQTSGHARGGITYVIRGLKKPVAIVGDALFAGSMGGGQISYEEALRTNREGIFSLPDDCIVCPGHGPLTTVGHEKRNNPFYPEFQE